jgi:hypothetical protein
MLVCVYAPWSWQTSEHPDRNRSLTHSRASLTAAGLFHIDATNFRFVSARLILAVRFREGPFGDSQSIICLPISPSGGMVIIIGLDLAPSEISPCRRLHPAFLISFPNCFQGIGVKLEATQSRW